MPSRYFCAADRDRDVLGQDECFLQNQMERILSRLCDLTQEEAMARINFGKLLRNAIHVFRSPSIRINPCKSVANMQLKHDRVPGLNAGFAKKLHVIEKFLLGIGEDVAGMQHGVHFFQQGNRFFDGNPVAGVCAILQNLFQQNGKSRAGLALQMAQKAA
jgi:hypothetical protein